MTPPMGNLDGSPTLWMATAVASRVAVPGVPSVLLKVLPTKPSGLVLRWIVMESASFNKLEERNRRA